ncbi:MAG: hypothetical protein IAX21_10820 [Candidatus Bathyarchaeota archaeon]|nr:MAG: hypothetical protein IAX21_10820 [Candidatus Bathyarchaeota archaeon]
MNKKKRISVLVLTLSVTLILASISLTLAQANEATIVILPSAGGDTSPAPGTYVYPEGTEITLEATPDDGFRFLFWVVSGEFTPNQSGEGSPNEILIDGELVPIIRFPTIDFLTFTNNPAQITCGFGYTYEYQAVFVPIVSGIEQPDPFIFDPLDTFGNFPISSSDISFVSVSSTVGGSTNPDVGNYIFGQNAEPTLTLSATPNEGYEFQFWIVTGDYMPGHGAGPALDTNVIPVNPLEVSHGMGHSYNYEAVFTPIDMDTREPQQPVDETHPFGLSSEILTALIIILVIAVIVAIAFGLYMYSKRSK